MLLHVDGLSCSQTNSSDISQYSGVQPLYGNRLTGFNFGSSRSNSRTVISHGNENFYGFNELKCGPRAGPSKNSNAKQEADTVGKEDSNTSVIPDKEMYKREDFPEEYPEAKFFIIKSYSEDDIHKSIKYGVWSSTSNGNKKLDAAYNESREKAGGCPVFLFFFVNASGQFVGVAEMVGLVDLEKEEPQNVRFLLVLARIGTHGVANTTSVVTSSTVMENATITNESTTGHDEGEASVQAIPEEDFGLNNNSDSELDYVEGIKEVTNELVEQKIEGIEELEKELQNDDNGMCGLR